MTSSPRPADAALEELHFAVPVAGSDHRWESASHLVFGKPDVFRAGDRTLTRFSQLVDSDTWQYTYVVFPVDLGPLKQGDYREVSVTATFLGPDIVAKHQTDEARLSPGSIAPTRGVGSSTVTWVLKPTGEDEYLPLAGHQLCCLLQRPKETAESKVVIEVSATVLRGLTVRKEQTATMREPRRYRLSFEKGSFTRVPGQEGEEDDLQPVMHVPVRTPKLPAKQNRTVIVFHGRNIKVRRELNAFLRAIDLHPIEWTQVLELTSQGAPYIGDALDAAMNASQAILVLMTPDDVVYLKPEHGRGTDDPELRPQGQARPNVLFEAGLSFGRFPDRTVLVELGTVRQLSDLGGRYVIKLNGSAPSRLKLARRLEAVGCPVNLNGTDWLTAGDLTPPPDELPSPPGVAAAPGRPAQGTADPMGRPSKSGGRPEPVTFDKIVAKPDTLGNHVVYGEVLSLESDVSFMSIDATFYSTSGEILGTAQGAVSGLTAGSPKNFQLMTFEDVAGYADIRVQVGTQLS
ncbi:nucleotide-binding protein [Streptomyces sp. ME02-6991-2A]|uniref:TIR domain-containing protein n=1 Tax=Streptomyces TaxID=1883 RepID=UPI0015C6210B|nr:nucleotide-binding protein [Streptomyces sp. ME02-6991-2A]MDX3374599.1 nucleotide-binding protein [Streptomyces sp. ME02-6991-2A]